AGREKILKTVYEILTIQRDYGNRSDRKNARLKYTLDKYGAEWFKEELQKRSGFSIEPEQPFILNDRKDQYRWLQSHKGLWYYTVFIENGRVLDNEQVPLKTALLAIARTRKANFRFTCNQNVIISDIAEKDKNEIEGILNEYGIIAHTEKASGIRKNAMACVAFNTCPLALAEGQRYLPILISKIEVLLSKHQLDDEEIIIRMTGCPNGCARPYAAEIGLIGTAYGQYNLYLGGDKTGIRLNALYKENIGEVAILNELDNLFGIYKQERR